MQDEILKCWRCGNDLSDEPLPLSRFAKCRTCDADLRCCLLCTKYSPDVAGQCRDDNADYVQNKDQANFCSFFRPSARAFQPDRVSKADQAKVELDALFGGSHTDNPERETKTRAAKAEESMGELERLFGKNRDKPD